MRLRHLLDTDTVSDLVIRPQGKVAAAIGTAVGATVTLVYRPGEYRVRLTVTDGLSSSTAFREIVSRTLVGRWSVAGPAFFGVSEYRFLSGGFQTAITVAFPGEVVGVNANALLSDPRNVLLAHSDPGVSPACVFSLLGEADAMLQRITGTLACQHNGTDFRCRTCAGQTQPITLVRQ